MKIEDLQKGQKILIECEFDSFAGANQAWVLMQGKPELAQLDNIKLDQPKKEIPQFVADWYEEHKVHLDYNIWKYIRNWDFHKKDDFYFFMNDYLLNAIQTLNNMHQFGYTVEKEKLYTVEIPDPNTLAITVLARSNVGDVVMCNEISYRWKKKSRYQLTESEIRKDFDWAWQWAEEVTE